MLEVYLQSLERELSRSLPSEEVQARLAEVETHLQEDIQARIDLGIEAGIAEAEAVAAFGDPRRFARACRNEAAFRPERWRWLIAMTLPYATPPGPFHTRLFFVPFLIFGAALIGFARASFRIRRPARLSVAIALAVAVAVPIFYVFGFSHEGFGNASRMVLVDGPRSILPSSGRAVIDASYECRFLLAMALGIPAGVDLLFAGLGGRIRVPRRRAVA